jgi:DNA polymerase III subunit epsilon
MGHNFTAVDFETAQGKRWSICQIGLVRIENKQITNRINLLVCPPGNIYFSMNTQIHGISERHTRNAPNFSNVWPHIKPFIENQTVVAHNGAFDFNCLSQTLSYYKLAQPNYQQQCTLKIYGKGLALCCAEYKISLKHHDALSDALACAELYQIYLNSKH